MFPLPHFKIYLVDNNFPMKSLTGIKKFSLKRYISGCLCKTEPSLLQQVIHLLYCFSKFGITTFFSFVFFFISFSLFRYSKLITLFCFSFYFGYFSFSFSVFLFFVVHFLYSMYYLLLCYFHAIARMWLVASFGHCIILSCFCKTFYTQASSVPLIVSCSLFDHG